MNAPAADRRPGLGLLFLVIGLAALAAFVALELGGNFAHLRQYGVEFLHRMPRGEASFYAQYIALLLPAALLISLGLAYLLGRGPFEGGLRTLRNLPDPLFTGAVCGAGALLVFGVATFVLQNQPVTDDEWVYQFQADLLSRGKLFALPHPLREFFDNVFIVNAGKWYGKYPPGHPLLLVPGVALGFPRLLPILLAGLNLFLVYRLAREFLTITQARVATLLLLVSPFFLLTGGTLLSHTTCLTALLVMGLGAARAAATGSLGWGLLAGLGAGFAFLTRPYTALLIGLPIAAAWGWRGSFIPAGAAGRAPGRSGLRPWLAGLGIAALFLLVFLAINQVLTGNPFKTGYAAVQGQQRGQVIGFGEVIPGRLDHTPLSGLVNLGLTVVRLNFWTFGWPLSWLFVIAAMLWSPAGRLRVLHWILAATAVGSVFYFSMGVSDTGPVKYYEILPVLAILSAAGLSAFDARVSGGRRPGLGALPPALLIVLTLVGWGVFGRVQIMELRRLTTRIGEPYRAVAALPEPKLLVFTGLLQQPPFDSWVFSTPDNLPDQDPRVLYVRDRGGDNQKLIQRMPERAPYRLTMDARRRFVLSRLTGDESTRRESDEIVTEGIQQLRARNSRDAILKFVDAVRADSTNARAFKYLGWTCEQANLNDRAEPAYRRAVELAPNDPEAHYFYGRFLARRGRWREGEIEVLKALSIKESKEYTTVLDKIRSKVSP